MFQVNLAAVASTLTCASTAWVVNCKVSRVCCAEHVCLISNELCVICVVCQLHQLSGLSSALCLICIVSHVNYALHRVSNFASCFNGGRSTVFYLSITPISMQYHPQYIFLCTTDIFKTKTDIPRIFLEHECT